jgi:imidazolonepropionase-like amidohydrolase
MAAAGITTARDLGGGAWAELELRDLISRGETPGPRLICSGQPITSPGGHCHFWGGEADSVSAARAVIQRQVKHGVDLIKVMATGGRFTPGSSPTKSQFDMETLIEIVNVARALALPVAAHCHGTRGIEAAVRAGVHSIEHCSWVGESGWASDYQRAVAELMAASETWVSPTINRGWQRMIDADGDTLRRMRQALVAMREAGISFMASTDAGIPGVYHHHLPAALEVFAEVAALSPEETLRSATSRAAVGLDLAGHTGQLKEGYEADVLVVDGDPTANLECLTRPMAIWARGRTIRQP